ncbi:Coiled-coil domain-containing protein R3HCC1L [Nymphon striatum]|nr:Coiled-coil domain-containing protein R3HCC1L [Nymphon striatum]
MVIVNFFNSLLVLNYFNELDDLNHAVIFPALHKRYRFFIHKVVESYISLSSFSIGEGWYRRTIVCFNRSLLKDNICTDIREKSLTAFAVKRCRMDMKDSAKQFDQPFKNTKISLSQEDVKIERARPGRTRRPDMQVYVPRARRSEVYNSPSNNSQSESSAKVKSKNTPRRNKNVGPELLNHSSITEKDEPNKNTSNEHMPSSKKTVIISNNSDKSSADAVPDNSSVEQCEKSKDENMLSFKKKNFPESIIDEEQNEILSPNSSGLSCPKLENNLDLCNEKNTDNFSEINDNSYSEINQLSSTPSKNNETTKTSCASVNSDVSLPDTSISNISNISYKHNLSTLTNMESTSVLKSVEKITKAPDNKEEITCDVTNISNISNISYKHNLITLTNMKSTPVLKSGEKITEVPENEEEITYDVSKPAAIERGFSGKDCSAISDKKHSSPASASLTPSENAHITPILDPKKSSHQSCSSGIEYPDIDASISSNPNDSVIPSNVSLNNKLGNVKLKSSKINYLSFTPPETDMSSEEFQHVLELYDFPPEIKTQDLIASLSQFKSEGFDIKWVDDTHALAVFPSPLAASSALSMKHALIKSRPLSEAILKSKQKARHCSEFLLPYKLRPKTSAALARRMVTGALGLRVNVPSAKREEEQRQLKEAKEKKKLIAKQKQDIWEGNI